MNLILITSDPHKKKQHILILKEKEVWNKFKDLYFEDYDNWRAFLDNTYDFPPPQ